MAKVLPGAEKHLILKGVELKIHVMDVGVERVELQAVIVDEDGTPLVDMGTHVLEYGETLSLGPIDFPVKVDL